MAGQSYRSKLNPYLEYIREARLRGETWEAIAEEIGRRGTPTDRAQVCKFFQRKERGRTPLGFAPEPHPPQPEEDRSASGEDADLSDPAPRRKLILKVNKHS